MTVDLHNSLKTLETKAKDLKTAFVNPATPLPPDNLTKHIISTYHRLRLGMGLMALFFPALILAAGYYYDVDIQNSFSAYYFGLPAADLQVNPKVFPGIFPTRVFFQAHFALWGCS